MLFDSFLQLRSNLGICFGAGNGGEVGPEKGVVDVATSVEFYCRTQRYDGGKVRIFRSFFLRLQGFVEVGHVGVVMFAVMEFHDGGRDGGFEGLAMGVK